MTGDEGLEGGAEASITSRNPSFEPTGRLRGSQPPGPSRGCAQTADDPGSSRSLCPRQLDPSMCDSAPISDFSRARLLTHQTPAGTTSSFLVLIPRLPAGRAPDAVPGRASAGALPSRWRFFWASRASTTPRTADQVPELATRRVTCTSTSCSARSSVSGTLPPGCDTPSSDTSMAPGVAPAALSCWWTRILYSVSRNR